MSKSIDHQIRVRLSTSFNALFKDSFEAAANQRCSKNAKEVSEMTFWITCPIDFVIRQISFPIQNRFSSFSKQSQNPSWMMMVLDLLDCFEEGTSSNNQITWHWLTYNYLEVSTILFLTLISEHFNKIICYATQQKRPVSNLCKHSN